MKPNPAIAILILTAPFAWGAPEVAVSPTPGGGIQPVAEADADGNIHVVYFKGDAAHGDLFHAIRPKGSAEFGKPVRVNSTDGSAIAMGTIRGAQIALGKSGHVHVVWNGSSKVTPEKDHRQTPMLYARSTDGGKTFEAERNLITKAKGLDGGGAVAADGSGKVEVFWHAGSPDDGETGRKVWVARSSDDGTSFSPEVLAWEKETGVCGCCGMTAGASASESFVLYRSATGGTDRDIYLLRSNGNSFTGQKIDQWKIEACPMSAMALSFAGKHSVAAWEAKGGDVAFSVLGTEIEGRVIHGKKKRKFPNVAVAPDGHVLLAWIDGGGWKRKGRLAWQLFAPDGKPIGEPTSEAVSAEWTKPAAVYDGDAFTILY
jgi:hypothetical protein